jgi:hypothetical protein
MNKSPDQDQHQSEHQPRVQVFHLDEHLLQASLLEALDCLDLLLAQPCPPPTRHLAHAARLRLTYFLGQFRVPSLDQEGVLRRLRDSHKYLAQSLEFLDQRAHQFHQGQYLASQLSPTLRRG